MLWVSININSVGQLRVKSLTLSHWKCSSPQKARGASLNPSFWTWPVVSRMMSIFLNKYFLKNTAQRRVRCQSFALAATNKLERRRKKFSESVLLLVVMTETAAGLLSSPVKVPNIQHSLVTGTVCARTVCKLRGRLQCWVGWDRRDRPHRSEKRLILNVLGDREDPVRVCGSMCLNKKSSKVTTLVVTWLSVKLKLLNNFDLYL